MNDKTTQFKLGGGLLPSTPTRMVDLMEVAEGSVLSRTLAKTKGGNLTLFAFDKGEGLSEHTAPFDAYIQVLEGEVELTIEDKVVKATTGETVLLPAGIPHSVIALEKLKMLLTMFINRD